VAEFSAHERRFICQSGWADPGAHMAAVPGRARHACRRARLPFHFQLDRPPPRFPHTEQRLPFKPAPRTGGSCGLTGAFVSLLCPSWWPGGPNPRLAEGPWPSPSGPLPAARVLLSFLDLKTHVYGHDYMRSFPSHARFPGASDVVSRLHREMELQGMVNSKNPVVNSINSPRLLGTREDLSGPV